LHLFALARRKTAGVNATHTASQSYKTQDVKL